jgi:cytochrome c biogenesis protein CcmG, thiol:disulfide interchange protein DsbE
VARASICLLALMLLLSSVLSGCYSGTRPPRIGQAAADFTVQDGEHKIALSDFRGKVVVLNFWASWCPPCVEETPSLVKMQHRLQEKGVVVIGISWDVDSEAYHNFLKSHGIDFLTVRDDAQNTGKVYGTVKIPETYIIDRKGIVRRKFISSVDWNEPDVVDFLSKL